MQPPVTSKDLIKKVIQLNLNSMSLMIIYLVSSIWLIELTKQSLLVITLITLLITILSIYSIIAIIKLESPDSSYSFSDEAYCPRYIICLALSYKLQILSHTMLFITMIILVASIEKFF